MTLNKIRLREAIQSSISEGIYKKDQTKFATAAIWYGIYRAIGGRTVIALPPIYQSLYDISLYMAKIKLKTSGRSAINYDKVALELSKAEFVYEMRGVENGWSLDIDIVFSNGKSAHIIIDTTSMTALSDLVYDLIMAYNIEITMRRAMRAAIKRELQLFSIEWGPI